MHMGEFRLSGKADQSKRAASFNPFTDTLTGADGKPFTLQPPQTAPEVPARNFERGQASYIDPPADGGGT